MKKLVEFFQLINVLSLDVAVGAIVSAVFFSKILLVPILHWGLLSLGLTVWIIYTTDHLADAKRINKPAATERHRFHQKHFQELSLLLILAVLLDILAISFVRKPLFQAGLVLAGAVSLYLLVQQNLKAAKEVSGAALYTLGVLLPAWSLSHESMGLSQILFMTQFAITVLCNLVLFSLFDFQVDMNDHHHSFVTVVGEKNTRRVLCVLFLLNGIMLLHQFVYNLTATGQILVMLCMNLILFLIFLLPGRFKANCLYRLFGDAVFVVPIFFLWM